MDLSKKNIIIDKSKILSASSIKRIADVPIEYIEPIVSVENNEDNNRREDEDVNKRNKIIVISIASGIALSIAIVAYLAFKKK